MTKTSKISVLIIFFLTFEARAQTTVDISKITCEQFRGYKITNPKNIALWLSGYFNGQKGNTVIVVQDFENNLEKVKDYCIAKPTVTVMKAVEAVLGPK